MISKHIIESFINKKYTKSDWVKKISKEEFEKEWIPKTFKPKLKPFKHQMAGIVLGTLHDNFLYFMDMGLGKTLIILSVLSIRKKEWKKVLVLSPNASTVATFGEEIEKHSDFSFIELMGTREERWEMLRNTNAQFNIINYTGLLTILTDSVKGKWVINKDKLKEFISYFDVLIIDEIHLVKNYKSLTFKILKPISENCKLKYGLTGTPLNNNPIDLWSQFYLIDNGETLGNNIMLFREAYFDTKQNFWRGRNNHPIITYTLKKELESNLHERISNKSIRYEEHEANDLPDKTFIKIPYELSEEARELYVDVQSSVNIEDIGSISSSFIKERMICSGFLSFENAQGIKRDLVLSSNPKLDLLVDLIENTQKDSKIVVFLDFIKSGELVYERLRKEKIKSLRLFGGTKDKKEVKNDFINKDYKVLIANTKSGGTGLNLQAASYVMYYELPLSSIDYTQSYKRVHRTGQSKNVFIYSLIAKNSVEEKVEKYLSLGKDIFSAIIEGKEKL